MSVTTPSTKRIFLRLQNGRISRHTSRLPFFPDDEFWYRREAGEITIANQRNIVPGVKPAQEPGENGCAREY